MLHCYCNMFVVASKCRCSLLPHITHILRQEQLQKLWRYLVKILLTICGTFYISVTLKKPELHWNILNLISRPVRVKGDICSESYSEQISVALFTPQTEVGWRKVFSVIDFCWCGQTDRTGQVITSMFSSKLPTFSFQEDLQQLILMPLPNVAILGQDPLTGTR